VTILNPRLEIPIDSASRSNFAVSWAGPSSLLKLRGAGVQSATVLVREGFVREFANGKAVVSYETMRRYLIPL
jgi:hypothetical protein